MTPPLTINTIPAEHGAVEHQLVDAVGWIHARLWNCSEADAAAVKSALEGRPTAVPVFDVPAMLDPPSPDLSGDLQAVGYVEGWNACAQLMRKGVEDSERMVSLRATVPLLLPVPRWLPKMALRIANYMESQHSGEWAIGRVMSRRPESATPATIDHVRSILLTIASCARDDATVVEAKRALDILDGVGPTASLPDPNEGDFDCPKAAQARACPCGFCVALRAGPASEPEIPAGAVPLPTIRAYAEILGTDDPDVFDEKLWAWMKGMPVPEGENITLFCALDDAIRYGDARAQSMFEMMIAGRADAASMAQRFLRWRLPDTFTPDAGISFDRGYCAQWATWPTGTNLFTADQATDMMLFVLATSPAGAPPAQQPLDDSANNAGVATGSLNESPSESVTRGSLQATKEHPPGDAREAAGRADAVPDGYVVVPRVLSEDMNLEAQVQVAGVDDEMLSEIWEAFLRTAAPLPQQPAAANQPMTTQGEDRDVELAELLADEIEPYATNGGQYVIDTDSVPVVVDALRCYTHPSPVADAEALKVNAARYLWLRDVSVPPHNFYLSVPVEFTDVRYTPAEVDKAIDDAIDARRLTGSQS